MLLPSESWLCWEAKLLALLIKPLKIDHIDRGCYQLRRLRLQKTTKHLCESVTFSELYFSLCVKFGSGVKLLRGLLNSFENPASFEIN